MRWIPVLRSDDLGDRAVASVDADGAQWVCWRGASGRAAVMLRRCPHLDADLALGVVKGDELVCHQHDWCFDADGRAGKRNLAGRLDRKDDVELPALREVDGRIELGFR